MALTRRQGTNIGLLLAVVILVPLAWLAFNIKVPVVENPQTRQGPNPDGSWGKYEEPIVQVKGITINRETEEVIIYLTVDLGTGGKYLTHATLPLDSTIEENP